MRTIFLCSLLAATLLGGCANLAPPYSRPAAPVPEAWADEYKSEANSAVTADSLGWREFITDERLRQVIALALANNRDLRVAALNIEKARGQYRIQNAELFPAISATAQSTRQRVTGPVSGQSGADLGFISQYSVNLGFTSYELDFFGKTKNLSDAALQKFLSTAETRRSTQIILIAETATAWLTFAADIERLKLAQDTLKSRRNSYELIRRTHDLGAASGLTLAQAQTTVDSARVDVAGYIKQIALDRNALALLAGATVPDDLLPAAGLTSASMLVDVPAELPSSVLQRRPDVVAAEHALQASNADIGAARAAFFPSITLTASAGSASSSLTGLFADGSGAWSFLPSINLPIFNAGSNRANLNVTQAQHDIELATYEKTLQAAFREVADALAQRRVIADQLAAQQSLQDATERSYTLSDALFRNGSSSYLEVLDAQRSLYMVQQASITLRLSEQTSRITLYKALGGGGGERDTSSLYE